MCCSIVYRAVFGSSSAAANIASNAFVGVFATVASTFVVPASCCCF